jgi:hypothetical protein
MLQRHLLILQRFSGLLVDAPNAPNTLNAPLKRQGCVNVAHRLCSWYTAFIPWSKVNRKALKRLVTASLHHASGVVAGDFHPVSDCSVAEAMAGKTVSLTVVELGDSASIPTGSRYRIVIGGFRGSCE